MSNFANVSVAEDTPGHVALSGQATETESTPVSVTVTIEAGGETEALSFLANRDVTRPLPTVIQSVSDDQAGVWVVADDGQSAQLST